MAVARIGGVELHYEVLGEGEPVAFLNGVMMTTQSWVLQTALFRQRYRCLLHDFRGQLLSEKPRSPWTLQDHARDLAALLDHLGIESCHLVGTSYGGEVGMIFAIEHPRRVRTLSVISSVSEVGSKTDRVVREWRRAALEAPGDLYRTALPTTFSPRFVAEHPEVAEQGEERLRACSREFFTAFARLIDAFRQLDITDELHRIRCPTLVLVGEDDALKPPEYSRLIAEKVLQCEYLMVPGAGHAVILERADEVNSALLGFLVKHA